jgi:hypothetical protein
LDQNPRHFYITGAPRHRQLYRQSIDRLARQARRRLSLSLQHGRDEVKNWMVPISDDTSLNAFIKLADNLGELEVTIGERARPAVAELRQRLRAAVASRERGDLADSLEQLRGAMERLAAVAAELDPAEGALMRMVAQRFTDALKLGDKSAAKDAVTVMRHKSGDPSDEDGSKW